MQKTLGEKLRKAREQKNLTLEDVYRQTKIHPRVLNALEQDRAHNFLSPLYIKGFLKSYAQFLGLDAQKTVKEYNDMQKQEKVLSEDTSAQEAPVQKQQKKKRRSPIKINIKIKPLLAVRIVLILLALFFVVKTVSFIVGWIGGLIHRGAEPKVKVEVLPSESSETEEISGPSGFRGFFASEEADEDSLVLEIRTTADCWMRVKIDGEVIFERTMPKGKSELWEAREKIDLRIGKPEGLEIFFNGEQVDLKKLKIRKGLVITKEGIEGR